MHDSSWSLDEGEEMTDEWFSDRKDYFKYFGRDMETLLAKTKIAHTRRVFGKSRSMRRHVSMQDVKRGFELYLENNEVKNRRDDKLIKADVLYSMYS